MLALSQVDAASRDAFIIFAVALSGLGMGSASPAMSTAIANAVDEHDLGIRWEQSLDAAFERGRLEQKPVLIAFSARRQDGDFAGEF